MLNKLPLWTGMAGAGWMVIAIRLVAVRAIFITNYIGLRTATMLPQVGREMPAWQDFWIFNSWLVLTGGAEFALFGVLLRGAIRRFSQESPPASSSISSSR